MKNLKITNTTTTNTTIKFPKTSITNIKHLPILKQISILQSRFNYENNLLNKKLNNTSKLNNLQFQNNLTNHKIYNAKLQNKITKLQNLK